MKPTKNIEHLPTRRHRALNRIHPFRTARAIWLANTSALILTAVIIISVIDPSTHRLSPDFHVLFTLIINIVLFNLLYLFNFRLLRGGMGSRQIVGLGLFGSIAISVTVGIADHIAEQLIYGHTFGNIFVGLIINISMALIAYLLSMLLYNVTEHQRTLIEKEQLQAENLRIHHEALEQQLSPHFMFNTLNTLDGLIGIDDGRAHSYLAQLAATLRYTLQQQGDVSLDEELRFTQAYLYLMQTRYGDALSVDIDIPDHLLTRRLPAISLQLLVENAIKHNVITQRHPLHIAISAADGAITVTNRLQPKADIEASNGIGLDNLATRYRLLFDREIEIARTEETFTVKIPLI